MPHPHLEPAPETVHWGFFDAQLKPHLTIASGERVTISSVSGNPEQMPGAPYVVPPALPAIHQKVTRKVVPGHICTGPVAVTGAKAGHVLQVDIESITPVKHSGRTETLTGLRLDSSSGASRMRVMAARAREVRRS